MMKKAYVKPALALESFVLSQSIASTCNVPGGGTSLGKPGHSSRETCGWDVGGLILWVNDSTGCNLPTEIDENVSGICYNAPAGGFTIFGS